MQDINDFSFYSISEFTLLIKNSLERNPVLNSVWIRGEISNLTMHSSGHIYLTLKDENAVLQSAFFKNNNKQLNFKLKEGMSVFALGDISVFEKRGNYQFLIRQMRSDGLGELQQKIEELKKRLFAEGIFSPEHKRELPFLPKRIGVVTSPTGAAFRDILKVALRRYPNIEIILAPAKVQGDDAAETIVRGIEELNKQKWGIDVIIAGRGGGSFEDLMPFNEEIVVRAFYNSRVPIISAVGHQIDHPLSDDAADRYAPTPSAAAEMAIPDKSELVSEVEYFLSRLNNSVGSLIREKQLSFTHLKGSRVLSNPLEIVYQREGLLDDIELRAVNTLKDYVAASRRRLLELPDMNSQMKQIIDRKNHEYLIKLQGLENLSPISILKRGYSLAYENNQLLKSVKQIEVNDKIDLQLADGSLKCTVDEVKNETAS